MGGAAVELVLQFARAAARLRRARSGSSGSGSKAGPIVGTLPLLVFEPVARSAAARSSFSSGLTARVEDHRGAGVDRVVALLGDVGGEDRGQRQQPDDDAGVAGGDRPAAVDRLRRAPAAARSRSAPRAPGRGRPRPGSAAAGSARPRLRQQREAAEAAGDEDRPRRGARARARRPRRRGGCRASAASGITVTTIAAPIGRQAPALDQQQDEQEERRGDRRRDHRQREVGEQVRAAGAAQLRLDDSRSPPRAWRRRGSAPRRPAPPAPGGGRSTARRRAR